MVVYYCEECGKKCQAKSPSLVRRFCSHQCANKHRWEGVPKKTKEITCQYCGKTFEVKNSDHRFARGGVKYCSKECASNASRKGKIVKCQNCGKEFYTTRQKFCGKECARAYRSEHYKHNTYSENGYITCYIKGYNKKGNVKEHRRVMEELLGRRLSADEVVHHINGVKTDNRPENLAVMKRAEHSSLHRLKEKAEGRHLFGGYHNN